MNRKRQKNPWTDEEEAKLIFMYNDQATFPDIANALGRSPGSVRNRAACLRTADRMQTRAQMYRPRFKPDPKAELAAIRDREASAEALEHVSTEAFLREVRELNGVPLR